MQIVELLTRVTMPNSPFLHLTDNRTVFVPAGPRYASPRSEVLRRWVLTRNGYFGKPKVNQHGKLTRKRQRTLYARDFRHRA